MTRQYYFGVGLTPHEQVERSKADAERALALQPRLPLGYYALGGYYQRRANYDRAVAEYTRGLALAPSDVYLLSGLASVDLRRGRWRRPSNQLAGSGPSTRVHPCRFGWNPRR